MRLLAFIRLTRPIFLLGGVLLYFLGAFVAWADGYALNIPALISGQALVTTIQLMTHYANEYFDLDCDRINQYRTWYSGGSGILVSGALPATTARYAMLTCAAIGFAMVIFTALQNPIMWILGTASLALAWSYSGPPIALVKTGFGEVAASVLVAALVPAVGYIMQAGGTIPYSLFLTCLPLVFIHFSMLITLQIPDFEADNIAGKRTLAVRFGKETAARMHDLALVAAFISLGLLFLIGWPGSQWSWLSFPLAIWQMFSLQHHLTARSDQKSKENYFWLTLRSVGLLALTNLLWLLGYAILILEKGGLS